jgi:tetratricopeptide (TPR) repeat protein
VITAQLHLAGLYRLQQQSTRSLELFTQALHDSLSLLGPADLLTATIWNNKGLVHKGTGQYEEALRCYEQAHHIRAKVLGEEHTDSIVCLHNQAECYLAMGGEEQEARAHALQQRILHLVPVQAQATASAPERAAAPATAPADMAAAAGVSQQEPEQKLSKASPRPPKPQPVLYTHATRGRGGPNRQ